MKFRVTIFVVFFISLFILLIDTYKIVSIQLSVFSYLSLLFYQDAIGGVGLTRAYYI